MLLPMLIFLVLIAAIGYWTFKSKKKKVPKKVSIPFLIIALILLMFGVNTEDSLAATNYNKEVEKNEQLTDDISELKKSNDVLQEKFDELETARDDTDEKIKTLEEENDKTQEEHASIQSENESLSEENDSLKSDNKKLQKELEKSEKNTKTSKESNNKGEKNTEANKSKAENKENTSADSSDNDSKKKSEAAPEDSTQATGDCEIKGSVNGIYHTPGSTYYSRTTNVEQWFCSEEEAVNAGYRAPER